MHEKPSSNRSGVGFVMLNPLGFDATCPGRDASHLTLIEWRSVVENWRTEDRRGRSGTDGWKSP